MNQQKNDNKIEEKDKKSIGEKVEDTLDDIVGSVQDVLYGDQDDSENIISTIEKPNGIREVNKIQTRRNINKRFIGKKGLKVFLIILGIGVSIGIITMIIEKLLLA